MDEISFRNAQKLAEKFDYKGAYKILQKLHKNEPNNQKITSELARVLVRNKKTREYGKQLLESLKAERFTCQLELAKAEKEDHNFDLAEKYLKELLKTANRNYAMLELGDLEVLKGDFVAARVWFNKLIKETNEVAAWKQLIYLDIYEENYQDAYDEYLQIEGTENDRKHELEQMGFYLRFKLGIQTEKDKSLDVTHHYYQSQLLDFSEKSTLKHLKFHKKGIVGKQIHGVFYDNINIDEMYGRVKEVLDNTDIKPYSFSLVEKYIIEFPYIIGTLHGEKTNQVQVNTIINTKDIITIYPENKAFSGFDIGEYELGKAPKEEPKQNVKTRKVSQIEKFNQRYGMK